MQLNVKIILNSNKNNNTGPGSVAVIVHLLCSVVHRQITTDLLWETWVQFSSQKETC